MKKIAGLAGLLLSIFIFFEGCSSSKPQNQESSLKEKETFTFDEVKSDSSAPLPIDSSDVVETNSEKNVKPEIPTVTTRKKPMDSQESPVMAPPKKKINLPDTTVSKADVTEKESTEAVQTGYLVQLGAFSSPENAKEFIKLNKGKIKGEMNVRFSEKVKLYLVQLPPVETKLQAQNMAKELRKKGFKDVFVVASAE